MPKFQVEGSDATTRIRRSEIVVADNAREATAVGEARGMRVEACAMWDDASVAALSGSPAATVPASAASLTGSTTAGDVPPGIAALASFFLPGLGQMLTGRVSAGLGWLRALYFKYFASFCLLLLPGFILHIICIIDAAKVPTKGRGQVASHPITSTVPMDDGRDQTVL